MGIRNAQIEMTFWQRRLELNRFLQRIERSLIIAEVVVSPTQVAVCLGVIRSQLNCALKSDHCFLPALALAKRISHVVVGFGIIGFEANNLFVSLGGVGIFAQ